ncbi:hypothetical protein ACTXKQ_09405 [Corynebacterium variabile]|uniref:Protein kinase domain-containing protein n=1 Tax=Corynebacterium variabile TaxID=1727 RepID=A0A0X2NM94_9CORY|nr:hypothetical protein [Corynebacterium variabile]CUU66605.1 hypothetical protein CVAR292_01952 [Corynebacterium variabile]
MSEKQRYALLLAVCDVLRVLQGGGIVIGDLSAKNLMFAVSMAGSGDVSASAHLIDCDSVSALGSVNPDSMETPGWDVPAGETRQTGETDRYKFGLLALRLLAGDLTTRDPGRLPKEVSVGVRGLVTGALTSAPTARPSYDAWWEALQQAALSADSSVPAVQPDSAPVAAPVVAPVTKRPVALKAVPKPAAQAGPPVSTAPAPVAQGSPKTSATGLSARNIVGRRRWCCSA